MGYTTGMLLAGHDKNNEPVLLELRKKAHNEAELAEIKAGP